MATEQKRNFPKSTGKFKSEKRHNELMQDMKRYATTTQEQKQHLAEVNAKKGY